MFLFYTDSFAQDYVGRYSSFFDNIGNTDLSSFLVRGTVVAAIPEPEICALLAAGLGVIGWVGRRKKLKKGAPA